MRINNSTTGLSMPRDPLSQYRQADPRFIESADSLTQALDYNRRQRAEFLEGLLLIDPARFDFHFIRYYAEDSAIVLMLSEKAAERALVALQPREVQ